MQRQLKEIDIEDIIESCEDKNYAEFLRYIYKKYHYYITNSGTFISKIIENQNLEQLFSAGLKSCQIPNRFSYTINDIPKSLIKIVKEKELILSEHLVKYWKDNVDAHCIAYELDFMSLNDDDLIRIFNDTKNMGTYRDPDYQPIFNFLIRKYDYNAKSLLLYIDYLKTYEALENTDYILDELYDYVHMMRKISNKFDKYPRNFLTVHKIACRNYNRLIEQFKEDEFKNRIDKKYECSFGEYTFVYPNSTQEIKDEAVQQNNCVASYIQRVIDGNCHILFLRKKGFENKSLVTIEVDPYQNKIVQAKGKFNRCTTEEENKVIEAWNKKFLNKREEIAA